MIFFRLAADADQLLTIAKFRALRKLWARVEAACGLAPAPAFVCAETAWRMMAQRDPHANILRATIAVFGAALGGADAISVLPFTAALGLPDAFARRVARNTQFVLLEESKLDKVADPAAGSGAFEDLTDQLCRAAWSDFQEIESVGGAAAALAGGMIGGKVAAIRAQRMSALACGREPLTGVSIFANLDEVPAATLRPRKARDNASKPLSPIRLAQAFETLRDASDRHRAATGTRPKIFLACLGNEADFTPRATFATNFFAAGGIEATARAGDGATLGESIKTTGADLACLCGTDKAYDSGAAELARSLRAAGARHVYLAGRPGAQEAALRAAGVQTFIDEGCDALATLRTAYDILGIEEAAL
jgi:methylmalonyl-CoA mutase